MIRFFADEDPSAEFSHFASVKQPIKLLRPILLQAGEDYQ